MRPRPVSRDDLYEEHIKDIVRKYLEDLSNKDREDADSDTLWNDKEEVGRIFLEDVMEYLDIDKLIDDVKGDMEVEI